MTRWSTTRFEGVHDLGDGRTVLSGAALDLRRWFDARFLELTRADGAREVEYPALIDRPTLERAGFFEAFPAVATTVGDHSYALSPAVCYHAYGEFAGRRLEAPVILTCVGRCFRREPAGYESLARAWEFSMREVVFLGRAEWIAAKRTEWMERARAFATSLGLAFTIEPATDPFFGNATRGRRLLQQLKALKYELRAPLAVASFNLHENFFTRRFDIRMADDSPAESGCVAFGLERWIGAYLAQRGVPAAEELCHDLR